MQSTYASFPTRRSSDLLRAAASIVGRDLKFYDKKGASHWKRGP